MKKSIPHIQNFTICLNIAAQWLIMLISDSNPSIIIILMMQKVICYIFGKLVGNFSYISYICQPAAVVELVDTLDLKSNGYLNGRAGSSPARGT